MMLRQKEPRQRDERHLRFVRAQPCCIPFCRRAAEAAHIRFACAAIDKPATGMQAKPDDKYSCPLCPYHHRIGVDSQHANNEREWWERTGLNPFEIASRLWVESGGAARALEPKPAKHARKIKARDRDAPKRKIQSRPNFPQGRKLQSRDFEKRPS
jgi:hypothetical protein